MSVLRLFSLSFLMSLCALAGTTVDVQSSLNPSKFGQPVTFSATVATTSPGANPSVTFTVDGTAGGPIPLVNGIAVSNPFTTLAVGTHIVSASFSGDGTIGTLVGGQVVQQVATTMEATSSANPALVAQSVAVTVRVKADVGTAAGSVTLNIFPTPITQPLLNGFTVFNLNSLVIGNNALTFQYSGTPEFIASAATINQAVIVGQTITTLTSSKNPALLSEQVQFTATVTSPDGSVFGGNMQFAVDGVNSGAPVPMFGNVAFSGLLTLGGGIHTVTASYSSGGGALPFAASVGTVTQVMNAVPTATVVTLSKPSIGAFESVEATATVTSELGTPVGSVQFTINGAAIPTPSALNAGVATATIQGNGISLGPVNVVADFTPAGGPFGGSRGGSTLVITPQHSTTTLTSSLNPSVTGQSITYTASIGDTPFVPGSVDFSLDGAAPANVPIASGFRTATFTPPAFSTAGIHTVTATYLPGIGAFESSFASLPGGQQVNAASLSTTISAAINPALVGQSLSYVATVDSPNVSPTGAVQFTIDGIPLGAPAVLTNGQAVSPQTTALTIGSHNVVATYTGNAGTSVSAPLIQVLTKASTSISVISDKNPANLGDKITFTATVTPQPAGAPTGTVTFYSGTTALNMQALTASGVVTFATDPLPTFAINAGNLPITAVYSGDANYVGSTSPIMQETVLKGKTVLTWTSPQNIYFPQPLTATQLNATANVPGTFVYTPASGTVLLPGSNQQLTVSFAPDDQVNYSNAFKTVTINVLPASISISSPPVADPNPAFVNSVVRFSAAAASLAVLNVSWDFGDGSTDTSNKSNVTHKYTVAGTYTATFTVKDTTGQTVSANVAVVVNTPQPTGGAGLDSDGDGFSDTLEKTLNSDAFDAQSKPQTSGTGTVTIKKLQIKLNFSKPGKQNAIALTGSIPANAAPRSEITVDVGGVVRNFQLDATGVGRQGKDSIFFDTRSNQFVMKLTSGEFETVLAGAGLTSSPAVTKVPRKIQVIVMSNLVALKGTADVIYTSKPGKSGTAVSQ